MKTFKVRLEVLTPVHIGTGEFYEPLSFFINKEENLFFEVDFEKFCEIIAKSEKMRNLFIKHSQRGIKGVIKLYKLFEKLCNGFYKKEIKSFIKKSIKVFPDLVNHYYDLIELSDEELNRLSENELIKKFKKFEIQRIAILSNSNEPYIPGSSLKGSIRTAILNLRKDYLKGKTPEDYRKGKRYDGRALEMNILKYKDPKDDPFKLVKISDLLPVNSPETGIVYVVNRKKSGERASGPYQILEVIKEEAIFEGTLTLESSSQIKFPVKKEEIEKALKSFYRNEFKKEMKIVEKLNIQTKIEMPEEGMILRIGRHSGAECVTIDGFRKIRVKTKAGKKELPYSTTFWLASEDRKGSNLIAPFGWVKLSILE